MPLKRTYWTRQAVVLACLPRTFASTPARTTGVPRQASGLASESSESHSILNEYPFAVPHGLPSALSAPANCGSTSLQGYPRADVDVVAVRRDRQRLICLTNDHKALSDKCARLLADYHAALAKGRAGHELHNHSHGASISARSNGNGVQPMELDRPAPTANGNSQLGAVREAAAPRPTPEAAGTSRTTAGSAPTALLQPFARVEEMADGSPAFSAGLQVSARHWLRRCAWLHARLQRTDRSRGYQGLHCPAALLWRASWAASVCLLQARAGPRAPRQSCAATRRRWGTWWWRLARSARRRRPPRARPRARPPHSCRPLRRRCPRARVGSLKCAYCGRASPWRCSSRRSAGLAGGS